MITIYGASDDLVEVDGCEGADEFGAFGSQVHQLNWHGDLIAPDGAAMRVMGWYGPGGCWLFGVGQVDADKAFPGWPVSVGPGGADTCAYSVVLTIDAPDGTKLANAWPAESE